MWFERFNLFFLYIKSPEFKKSEGILKENGRKKMKLEEKELIWRACNNRILEKKKQRIN